MLSTLQTKVSNLLASHRNPLPKINQRTLTFLLAGVLLLTSGFVATNANATDTFNPATQSDPQPQPDPEPNPNPNPNPRRPRQPRN